MSSELAKTLPQRKRGGKLDYVSFKVSCVDNQTESAVEVAEAFKRLGGMYDICGKALDLADSFRVSESVEPIRKDKGPVPMTVDLIRNIHEPPHLSKLVKVDWDAVGPILRPEEEWPPAEPKWDGVWNGSEDSRLEYLRLHQQLWGLLPESEVKRFTSVFFITKKDGVSFRKILACVNCNNCCTRPRSTKLPGPWNLSKMRAARWKKSLFFVGEGDVDCFFSRLESPPWLMRFLCLRPVLVDDIIDFSQIPSGVYVCPYSNHEWRRGQFACPAWPRVPMGWSWSVRLATQLSESVARAAAFPRGVEVASLNVATWAPVRSADFYYGVYIDNIFTFGWDPEVVGEIQTALEDAFEEKGLVLGEKVKPRLGAKVVGIETGPSPKLAPPASVGGEAAWVADQRVIFFWMFERGMGKFSWCFPLRRRFFSILRMSFFLLAKLRKRELAPMKRVRLPRAVRDEFRTIAVLSSWLEVDLTRENGLFIYACDASLQGWAICKHESGGGFLVDSRELQFSPSVYVLHLTGSKRWRCLKRKKFAYRLSHILPGEICSFRQTVTLACRENPSRRVIVLTDNANIYFSVRKGRSGVEKLNTLCRHVLLCELVYNCQIEVRWVPSEHMPADRWTRIWE